MRNGRRNAEKNFPARTRNGCRTTGEWATSSVDSRGTCSPIQCICHKTPSIRFTQGVFRSTPADSIGLSMRKGDAFKSEVSPTRKKAGLQKCGIANGSVSTIERNISFMGVRLEKLKGSPHRHHCPECGSRELTRVRRKGLIDWLLAELLALRPYDCDDCGRKCHLHPHTKESKSAC
jgi:predicted RNA-binding Zn-ribbon protein involved in translation (DUF1610 family)